MNLSCQWCGETFATEDKRRKFCGTKCYRAKAAAQPNGGAFRSGAKPWNRDLKGIHLSPASEFRKGQRPVNTAAVGEVRIRNDKNSKPRAWVKIGEPNHWLLRAHVNWWAAGMPLKSGEVLHHKDHDTLNDDVANLEPTTRAEHLKHHRPDFETKRLAGLRRQSSIFDVLGGGR